MPGLTAGSWVYGDFTTWMGDPAKNRAWDLLCAAKTVYDRVMAAGRLSQEAARQAELQLRSCESSDWFWWFGDYNPGGKLPITVPRSVGQLPDYYYQKPSAKREYLDDSTLPLFPFGWGLSYSTFKFANLHVTPNPIGPEGTAQVSVDVTNTSQVRGDEVVQLYIRDEISSVTRPIKELRGFRRISLDPGQTKTVEFSLGFDALSFLNRDMHRVVEPGDFKIMVGGNSVDLIETNLTVADR